MPDFSDERNVKGIQSENEISELLYLHLTRKAKFNAENIEHPFAFQPEKPQKKRNQKGHPKRTDIAARLNTIDVNMEVIYCIEAKKLPTDKKGGKREKEYVFGKFGAIERFKNEVHGLDDEGNLLSRNGIVAYIFDSGFNHWYGQINQWIIEQGWEMTEQLSLEYSKKIGKLTSVHSRISGSLVRLSHFWINL